MVLANILRIAGAVIMETTKSLEVKIWGLVPETVNVKASRRRNANERLQMKAETKVICHTPNLAKSIITYCTSF